MPLGDFPYTNRLSKLRIQARHWLSSAAGKTACYSYSGALTSNGHNLEYGDTCNLTASGDITDTNPLLGPLSYESTTWIHPLLEGSPATDQGLCPPGVTTVDQRGVTRPQGDACDIGAYEYKGPGVYLPLVMRSY